MAGLAVTPGEKYVVFASIDKDYEQCLHTYSLGWGWIAQDVYPEGYPVSQENRGDEQRWTTKKWKTRLGDFAFKADLTP
ncbi:MAG: hypothetical protein ACJ8EL_06715 [Rhizomicrobium sp.]|jgi:hypothetical protein